MMPDPPDAEAYDKRNWGVHFIGIDLAWGERSPSGVAVLAEDGTKPATWAYREGRILQAASDLQYVDQPSFDLADFDLDADPRQ